MSMNSSSFNSSVISLYLACQKSIGSKTTVTMFSLFSTFLLSPIYLLILWLGFRRWRCQRTKMSHTDFFTYNMMILEIFCVLGSVLYTFSLYINRLIIFRLGMVLFYTTLPTQTLFHVLTSMERYLAVVHPITYVHLRESLGVRIRNISTVCVWLLGFGWTEAIPWYSPWHSTIFFFSLLGLCVVVIFFCCLSVLQSLTRSRSGELDKGKEQTDQAKLKAFHMISAITGALLLRIGGVSIYLGLSELTSMDPEDLCALMDSGMWLMVPSSLVLPLLFLHREGKLPCSRIQPAV